MNEKIVENLKSIAKKKAWADKLTADGSCIIDDFAGGNVDDAYYGGCSDGEILLARNILDRLSISYE